MTWNDFSEAPQDGTPILILDKGTFGNFSASVRYQAYDPEDAKEIGAAGYWHYCDELLNDACPQGPQTPFVWRPDPATETDM